MYVLKVLCAYDSMLPGSYVPWFNMSTHINHPIVSGPCNPNPELGKTFSMLNWEHKSLQGLGPWEHKSLET